jgi:hypothetical protein
VTSTIRDGTFHLGNIPTHAQPAQAVIDDFKWLNDVVIPYGAIHIGNGQGLLADIDTPYKDLCFFWDCQSDSAKGGANLATSKTGTKDASAQYVAGAALVGTYGFDSNGAGNGINFDNTSLDIFDLTHGTIVVWFNIQTLPAASEYIVSGGVNSSDYMGILVQSDGDIEFRYVVNSSPFNATYAVGIITGEWHCAKIQFSDSDNLGYVSRYFDGEPLGTTVVNQAVSSQTNSDLVFANRYDDQYGVDVFIGRAFVTTDPNTPEIWTAFGKPLHVNLTDKS